MLWRARWLPVLLVAIYAVLLVVLALPAVQTEFLFLHRVNLPLPRKLDHPEHYGLAPFKTRNLKLTTTDGERIGAWHILPRSYYRSVDPFPPSHALTDDEFEQAFIERPTVLYFHGNAANRAAPFRVRGYSAFSTQLDCNVLAIDYRGFGDSTGSPSEEGVVRDARAAWDYVAGHVERLARDRGEKVEAENMIILVGQSMGTGVASLLAGQLAQDGLNPRAIVLIAPFYSAVELMLEYWLFDFIPLLQPLRLFPKIQAFFQSRLAHPFKSSQALMTTSSPILLNHAVTDTVIPHSHSARLFEDLRSHSQVPPDGVHDTHYGGWGHVRSFARDHVGAGPVFWWEGLTGGHNNLGWTEGVMDLIAKVAGL
ncbi:hypothetical protein JCM24511_05743 [Saitozyma sp. JCM 24511]|nr:hypothetical protein JCM24511_05743 [Saitozyma sp. JCM 24511]